MVHKSIRMLLSGALVLLLFSHPAAHADAAPFDLDQLPSGYLIIGTYIIYKDALNEQNLPAAQATMESSGQGMYYKSEYADGTWFRIDSITDLQGISDPQGTYAVAPADVKRLKLTVWVDDKGGVVSLLGKEELSAGQQQLKEQDKQANDDYSAALSADDTATARSKLDQIAQLEAQIALNDALLAHDLSITPAQYSQTAAKSLQDTLAAKQQEAVAQLEAEKDTLTAQLQAAEAAHDDAQADQLKQQIDDIGQQLAAANPDADAGNAQQAASGEGEGQQAASGDGGGQAEADKAKAAQLQAQLGAVQDDYEKALQGGDMEAAGTKLEERMALESQLALLDQGLSAQAEALQQAKDKLTAALSAAQADGSPEQADAARQLLQNVEEQIRKADIQQDFAVKAELSALLAEKPPQPLVDQIIAPKIEETVDEIKQLELEKYAQDELSELQDVSGELQAAYGSAIDVLPVNSLISKDFDVRLDVPPVLIGGYVYIPVRPISEAFGALVVWNPGDSTVTIGKEGTTAVAAIDSDTAYLNGNALQLPAAPRLLNGRAMVPLRFVADSLGLAVNWDGKSQTVEIDLP